MHLFGLVFGRGLVADTFGCAAVSAAAQVPPQRGRAGPDTAASQSAGQAFFVLQQGLQLPRFAPRVEIAHIDFPHVQLIYRLQRARRGVARLELEHLQWHMTDFLVDPADSIATSRPLFSRRVELAAANFIAHPDSAVTFRIAGLEASLSDSTVEIRGIAYAPTVSDSAFARAQPYRRSLVKSTVARVSLRGLDAGVLAVGEGVRARRVEVDSLRIDVLSDRRRPANPRPPIRRTPQQWIADLEWDVRVDSVIIRHGQVAYREQRPRRLKPGVLTFARLDAVAVNVLHVAGRRSASTQMTLHATAYLQDVGRLDARFVAPLDGPSFELRFAGRLGPMPVTRLNPFIEETFAVRLDKGRVAEIRFDGDVHHGVARGTIVPRYKDLAVEVTGRGATGILGTGGVIGDAARGIATFVGNLTEIHGDNPDDGAKEPRRGQIDHTFTSTETLPAFLWTSLRGGLMAVVHK